MKSVAPKCDITPIHHESGGKTSTAVVPIDKKERRRSSAIPTTGLHLSSSLETVGTTKVAVDLNETVRLALMGSNIGSACFQHPPLQNIELRE